MAPNATETKQNYGLIAEGLSVPFARAWLLLGIVALALAGLFAILLVLARAPFFQAVLPYREFFQTALVVHVNLSVLVWLLSFLACLMSFLGTCGPICSGIGFAMSAFGALMMAASPFAGEGIPLLNNYIPMFQHPWFYQGLAFFGFGIGTHAFFTVGTFFLKLYREPKSITPKLNQFIGIGACAIIILAAFGCFFWSSSQIEESAVNGVAYDRESFFEHLFWGGGHLLQFVYAQGALIVWLWLAERSGLRIPLSPKMILALMLIGPVVLLPTPLFYINYYITDFEHLDAFTQQMRMGLGIASGLLGILLFVSLILYGKRLLKSPERSALFWSLLLYLSGGVIAMGITANNTKIPAHYHGSIVGITLAFMGLAYTLLPQLGFAPIRQKLARIQTHIYGTGQLLHIIGLAISGGYGALRKTPGAMQSIEGKIAMGIMGAGGSIAAIGGLLFVIVTAESVIRGRNALKWQKKY